MVLRLCPLLSIFGVFTYYLNITHKDTRLWARLTSTFKRLSSTLAQSLNSIWSGQKLSTNSTTTSLQLKLSIKLERLISQTDTWTISVLSISWNVKNQISLKMFSDSSWETTQVYTNFKITGTLSRQANLSSNKGNSKPGLSISTTLTSISQISRAMSLISTLTVSGNGPLKSTSSWLSSMITFMMTKSTPKLQA